MRCIEIGRFALASSSPQMINRNMRCIEMTKTGMFAML